MEQSHNETSSGEAPPRNNKKILSAFASVASASNILLSTGPYILPLGYCRMGFILSPLVMLFTMIYSYICFEYVLETMSISAAL